MDEAGKYDIDLLTRQIEAEKADIERLENMLSKVKESYIKDVTLLKEGLSKQHEILAGIIEYAKILEDQMNMLKGNVHQMSTLHRSSLH